MDNYLEATGLMAAMQAGVSIESILRPIHSAILNRNPTEPLAVSEQHRETKTFNK